MGKVLPEAGVQMAATEPSTRSVAVAEEFTAAPDALVAGTVIAAGSTSVGDVESCTVTVKLALELFPWASVAEQVTVELPMGKVLPEAGVQLGVTVPSTRSVAVGPA